MSSTEEAEGTKKANSDVEVGPNTTERSSWNNPCEFFLTSLGLAVGLGNLWRFPYVCYENGGGTFLIPYVLSLLLVGLPLFFMEMILGQYAGLSATKIYARLAPGLRGMGYGMVTIPTVINFYYTVIMAYSMYFLFAGFTADKQLPWGLCDQDYNTANCYSLLQAEKCANTTVFYNRTCTDINDFCIHFGYASDPDNTTHCFTPDDAFPVSFQNVTFRVPSSEEFWYKKVLELGVTFSENGTAIDPEVSSWTHWGDCNWKIAGCLLLCWALICLALINGIQSYGKVAYFTTLFPYVVLTVLLGYTATLPGFSKGIEFYLVPQWDKLWDMKVWNAAAGQIFYSLGVAVGSQLLLSSYNPFTSNAHRDALLIGFCNSLTSLYAGFVVFGVVGFIATKKNMPVESVINAGPGLAFVVYPEAVSTMDISPLFSFLFFFMLILLAISSVCGSWEALVASLMDEFPQLRSRRKAVMVVSCFIAFLAGFPICFQSGFLLFQLMDNRSSNAILLMAFVELIIVSWFYGVDNFIKHIGEMGMRLPGFMVVYWKACWLVITPILIGGITIISWVQHPEDEFLGYLYPGFAQFMGWGIELLSIGIVIAFSVHTSIKKYRQGHDIAFVKAGPMMSPKHNWAPRPDSGLVKTGEGLENPAFVLAQTT